MLVSWPEGAPPPPVSIEMLFNPGVYVAVHQKSLAPQRICETQKRARYAGRWPD